ncbi:hypothetical protein QWZ06_07660 [Chryseobacterium tructae]|uniref:Uncharacterized protein n=1 Tax=Chryseobacterium tructae TaxID=1037380 RepID=A0ABV7XV61_9FLAO|nr:MULTISPECIES: hypothetical protein [Chryseobacterium]MDN3692145.1 hypothetical protein [Chryseobacterium tructae]
MNEFQYFSEDELKTLPLYFRFMFQMDFKKIRQMESGYETSTASKIHKSSAYQRYVSYKPTTKLKLKKIDDENS